MPRPSNFVDMTGQKFGRLTALAPIMRGNRKASGIVVHRAPVRETEAA